jgi:hypothetical protein
MKFLNLYKLKFSKELKLLFKMGHELDEFSRIPIATS